MVSWFRPSSILDKVFEGGIVLKGIMGMAEFLGGFALLFVDPASIHTLLVVLTQKELSEDPNDRIANFLLDSTSHLDTGVTGFVIAYLWVHAAIKLTSAIGLLRNQMWAYPFSLITLGLLVVYQSVSLAARFSAGMFLLTLFDIGVLWLIAREYAKVRRHERSNLA